MVGSVLAPLTTPGTSLPTPTTSPFLGLGVLLRRVLVSVPPVRPRGGDSPIATAKLGKVVEKRRSVKADRLFDTREEIDKVSKREKEKKRVSLTREDV